MAAEAIDKSTIEEFEAITKYSLTNYFKSFDFFIKNNYPNIISYYGGNINSLDSTSFNNLNALKIETQKVFEIFTLNKNVFLNYKFWVLIDTIEQLDNALMMIDNSSKWMRSAISKGDFNPNPEVSIPLNQGQTLEFLERTVLGSEDYENTWSSLALKNDLREEDYTSDGGFLIKANFN